MVHDNHSFACNNESMTIRYFVQWYVQPYHLVKLYNYASIIFYSYKQTILIPIDMCYKGDFKNDCPATNN